MENCYFNNDFSSLFFFLLRSADRKLVISISEDIKNDKGNFLSRFYAHRHLSLGSWGTFGHQGTCIKFGCKIIKNRLDDNKTMAFSSGPVGLTTRYDGPGRTGLKVLYLMDCASHPSNMHLVKALQHPTQMEGFVWSSYMYMALQMYVIGD